MNRRDLQFTNLDEVIPDAERLLAMGYDKLGQWTLGQCCGHLANWIRYPIEGYPPMPLLLRPLIWIMRQTVGKSFRKKMLNGDGKMDAKLSTIPASVPPSDFADAEGVRQLREALSRLKTFTGPVLPSPLLGQLTLDEVTKIHLIHCAHHLSFLIPKTNPAMTGHA